MPNKIIYQSETDYDELFECITRMYEVLYIKLGKEPIDVKYTITVTRKEEE